MFIQKNKKHILIVYNAKIPALLYGGIQRVINKGFKVSFLVKEGSYCDFATVLYYDLNKDLNSQIPEDVDLVHFSTNPLEDIKKPYLVTEHGNPAFGEVLNIQTVFVSKNHAERYGSKTYVHNGLDWDNYPKVNLQQPRDRFHFLANAAWKVKNLKGAINITKKANQKLDVLGGYRFNFKMGWRMTLDAHVSFKGMVNNEEKAQYISKSKGLIFPVLWNEPFGLAIIESLYFGCPVFATPYGSLKEIVTSDFGLLSTSENELAEAILHADLYSKKDCHQYAIDSFSADVMANSYIKLYEKIWSGEQLNTSNPILKEKNSSKYLLYS
jgi:glycosyltransferase involved in cell wall biosynthesis